MWNHIAGASVPDPLFDPLFNPLFNPVRLPCGVILKNRIVKSAMSDSLGDGTGHPSPAQNRLYRRWAEGGLAASIIGEVQSDPGYAEKPGNLVLNGSADLSRFQELARAGAHNGAHLWVQLGHAGALAYGPTSAAKGPSALDLPGLKCGEMDADEIAALPDRFANCAKLAQQVGFGGVEIHAAHGFLLSQFLSPLFNKRTDQYGGPLSNRMRPLLETIKATRTAVGPAFPIALKLNASDQLEGGFAETEALEVISALDDSSLDVIDISGGTYFPGAKSASDSAGSGPYFLDFAKGARHRTSIPLMLTGGFKSLAMAQDAITSGAADIIGLARALVLEPSLPKLWKTGQMPAPKFPRFAEAPEGGITAWYTMGLTQIGLDQDGPQSGDLKQTLQDYEARDQTRTKAWLKRFGKPAP